MMVESFLHHIYEKVEKLEDFLNGYLAKIPHAEALIQPGDSARYTATLKETLVCTLKDARNPIIKTTAVLSTQNQILSQVVKRICLRTTNERSTNILVRGCRSITDDPDARILDHAPDIQMVYPNRNHNLLLLTPWKTLQRRIGDAIMWTLLEHHTLFLHVSPSRSCYVQVCGLPLYELPMFKQCYVDSKCTGILRGQKKHVESSASLIKQDAGIAKTIILTKCYSNRNLFQTEKVIKRKAASDVDDDIDYCYSGSKKLRLSNSNSFSCMKPSDKKCDDDGGCCSMMQYMNVSVLEPRMHCNKIQSDSRDLSSESFVSAVESLADLDEDHNSNAVALTNNKHDHSLFVLKDIDHSTTLPNVIQQQYDVPNVVQCLNTKRKRRRNNTDKMAVNEKCVTGSAFSHSLVLERARMLYSKNFTEKYPPKYVLQKTSCTDNSAKCLAESVVSEILKTKVTDDNVEIDSEDVSKVPSSIRQQLVLAFETLIKKHRVCRYKHLLRFHASNDVIRQSQHVRRYFRKSCKIRRRVKRQRIKSKKQGLAKFSDKTEAKSHVQDRLIGDNLVTGNGKIGTPVNHKIIMSGEALKSGSISSSSSPCGTPKLDTFVCRRNTPSGTSSIINDEIRTSQTSKPPSGDDASHQVRSSSSVHSTMSIHHRKVFLFVRACVLYVIPIDLFGSTHNRNIFYGNIKTFISLRRFDRFSLGQLMLRMRPLCLWKSDMKSNLARLRLYAQILCWLIVSYVLPLIKSYFYVTDSADYRNKIFYYRKKDWQKIYRDGFDKYFRRGILKEVTIQEVKKSIDAGASLGVSTLRFLPKDGSLRPIVSMSSKQSSMIGFISKNKNVHWSLRDLLCALKYQVRKHREIIGSSVFSVDDIYAAWKRFILLRTTRNDKRPLHFVKVDIKNCYDSIDKQKLFSIVTKVLKRSSLYNVRTYSRVFVEGGRLRRSFHTDASDPSDFIPCFKTFVDNLISENRSRNVVFIDPTIEREVTTESLVDTLHSLLFECIIAADKKFYRQLHGITQGSPVSTMLCNLYYGAMEAQYIHVDGIQELLLRLVDDFIFVTPDVENARQFLQLMTSGIKDFNCFTNSGKSLVNFHCQDRTIAQLPDGVPLSWCGLLFDTKTLEVHADYTRYAGENTRDSVTIDTSHRAGVAMRQKLMFAIRGKCHAIYLDPVINSAEVRVINVFKIFLHAAFKFHAYVTCLQVTDSANKNPKFFLGLIEDISGYLWALLERLTFPILDDLHEPCATQWLCANAFLLKLNKHRSAYKYVCRQLKHIVNISGYKVMDKCLLARLRAYIGALMPEEFLKISD